MTDGPDGVPPVSGDFEDQLRRTLQRVRRDLPDPQPGEDFWRRVEAQRPRPSWWTSHGVQAVAASVVLLAVVGLAVAALRPSGPAVPSGSAGPSTSSSPADRCAPGPGVRPTATPSPAGDRLTVADATAGDLLDGVPVGSRRVDSPAFAVVRDVGGCVLAWQLPAGATVPDGVTRVSGAHQKVFTRADDAGRTEVYLVTDSGRVYLAVSGDVTAPDLAAVLSAAVTTG